jgi:hypothetical protein
LGFSGELAVQTHGRKEAERYRIHSGCVFSKFIDEIFSMNEKMTTL